MFRGPGGPRSLGDSLYDLSDSNHHQPTTNNHQPPPPTPKSAPDFLESAPDFFRIPADFFVSPYGLFPESPRTLWLLAVGCWFWAYLFAGMCLAPAQYLGCLASDHTEVLVPSYRGIGPSVPRYWFDPTEVLIRPFCQFLNPHRTFWNLHRTFSESPRTFSSVPTDFFPNPHGLFSV